MVTCHTERFLKQSKAFVRQVSIIFENCFHESFNRETLAYLKISENGINNIAIFHLILM